MPTARPRNRSPGLHEILGGEGENAPVTLRIVRHGATRLNGESEISVDKERGWSDVPLTAEGRQEARDAAAKLKGAGIEVIVSSDLKRAKETALIIGGILGVKPEFSFKLRPWNLGDLTGKVMTEAKPQIAAYANKPDAKVPGGESFHAFRDRAFEGLGEAVEKHQGKQILIVAHHRVERLIGGWEKAGQPEDHEIDIPTFMQKGDPPGGIITLRTSEEALEGNGMKLPNDDDDPGSINARARQEMGRQAVARNDAAARDTQTVSRGSDDTQNPTASPRQRFMDKVAQGAQAQKATAATGAQQPQEPVGGRDMAGVMAHGRAIAGAKALHAVGHISEAQRDRHIAKSQKAIGRKPFGAFAP